MYAIFDNLEEYKIKLTDINTICGYPNNMGTKTYCSLSPIKTLDGYYAIKLNKTIEYLFTENTQVESVSYPDEFADEIKN